MFKQKFMLLSIVFCICCLWILPGIATNTGSYTNVSNVTNLTAIVNYGLEPYVIGAVSSAQISQTLPIDIMKEKNNLTDNEKKLSTALLLETGKFPNVTVQTQQAIESGLIFKNIPTGTTSTTLTSVSNKISTGTLVYVYVYVQPGYSTHIIDSLVAEVTDRDEATHLAVAWVDTNKLDTVAAVEGVRLIREVIPPVVNIGSVTTQGDTILKTANVRSTYGYSGAGMKIGIISDGVDHLSSSVASGDLPSNVHVLSNTVGGDEGTAMLEIVHDMVPNATLYFHDDGSNIVAFDAAIDDLRSNGCTVICDDVSWPTEPFFEDGTVASHVNSVLSSNQVIYISATGNLAANHYQGTFYNSTYCSGGYCFNDFSSGTNHNDEGLYVNLPAGSSVTVVLEWNDKFGQSGNDYNLYLFKHNTANLLAFSDNTQSGTGDPLEYLSYTNTGSTPIAGDIDVQKSPGAAVKTLGVYIYPSNGAVVSPYNIVAAGSIFGQQAVPDVIAVAAVNQGTPSTIEPYSSRGPVAISYPSAASRSKPDISGVDCVSVTGAGGFENPFCGTSAAAPHIAAVVAQIWGAHPTLTSAQVRSALYTSAVDLGTAGKDTTFGYGRADALAMANLTAGESGLPTVTSVSPTSGPTAGGTSVTITGTGFTGATAVDFGTTAATITANTGTSITATSPAGSAGTVDVTVTTPGGTSATSTADQYTYIAAPTGSTTTVGIYRSTTGAFYLKNSNAAGNADMSFIYGNPSTDKPLVGDWIGQGKDTVGIYRSTTGAFYLKNSNAAGNADMSFVYGNPSTDIPLVGDWTGQTNSTTGAPIDTVGIYRRTTGAFYLKNSNAAGNADMSFIYGNAATDTPLVGDWI